MECEWSQRNRFESRLEVLWEPHTAKSNGQKKCFFSKIKSCNVPTAQMTPTEVVQNDLNLTFTRDIGTAITCFLALDEKMIHHNTAHHWTLVVSDYFTRCCCRPVLLFNLSSVIYGTLKHTIDYTNAIWIAGDFSQWQVFCSANHFGRCPAINSDPTVM